MTKAVKTVGDEVTVAEAVAKMNKFHIGSVVVVDESNKKKVIGILTERDILRLVETTPLPLTDRVKDVMTRQLVTIDPYSTLEEAAGIMTSREVKRLPVMEDGELVGIVTSSDVIRADPLLINALMSLPKPQSAPEPKAPNKKRTASKRKTVKASG